MSRSIILDFCVTGLNVVIPEIKANYILKCEPGQSEQSLATDWTTGRSRFDPRQVQEDFSSSLCVQTDSGAHPASCTMGSGVLYPGVKLGLGVTLTTQPHLVPRSRRSRSAFVACSGTALHFYMLKCASEVNLVIVSKFNAHIT
jgi:hypothetical protein